MGLDEFEESLLDEIRVKRDEALADPGLPRAGLALEIDAPDAVDFDDVDGPQHCDIVYSGAGSQGAQRRAALILSLMCNLNSITKGQQAIRGLFAIAHDRTGNLPTMPGIFPDYPAPIIRLGMGGRDLAMARWGMPTPKFALKGRTTDSGVTNRRRLAGSRASHRA